MPFDEQEHREHLLAKLEELHMPLGTRDGLTEYIMTGRPTGHFLAAIINNDLKDACNRADLENRPLLWNYVSFLHNNAPIGCWGFADATKTWREKGGLVGVMNTQDNRLTNGGGADEGAGPETTGSGETA